MKATRRGPGCARQFGRPSRRLIKISNTYHSIININLIDDSGLPNLFCRSGTLQERKADMSHHQQLVALITGANKGLGLEMARQLGRRGITVFIAARSLEAAKRAVEVLRAEGLTAQ